MNKDRTQDDLHADALMRLLDDPSERVRKAVEAEIRTLGDEGLLLLRRALDEGPPEVWTPARRLLRQLDGGEAERQMLDFIQSGRLDLETGLGLINRVGNPAVNLIKIRDQIDQIAKRCGELLVPPQTPKDICGIINRVMFHEMRFRGDMEKYERPENSFLDSVLRRRRGIPISLSAIYLLVASRLNFTLDGVGLPGHFMVGCFYGNLPFYIDPFQRGRIRSIEEVNHFLIERSIDPVAKYLMPVTVGEILARTCRNLAYHYQLEGKVVQAGKFQNFAEALSALQETPHG